MPQRPEGQAESHEDTPLRIDPDKQAVFWLGRKLQLTKAEFRLLHSFLRAPTKVLTRSQLAEAITEGQAIVQERTVDVHVWSLRSKFGSKDVIQTIRGVGYRANFF